MNNLLSRGGVEFLFVTFLCVYASYSRYPVSLPSFPPFDSHPQHCSECHNHFCARCIANSALKRSQQVCQRCCVFTLPVMERAELNALSLGDLRCYPNVAAPLNSSREQLLELILGYQARVLTERAQLAVRQLQRPGVDVLTVDAETLQPPSSAYSSAATARNLASSGSLPTTTSSLGATLGGDPATTRSKVN